MLSVELGTSGNAWRHMSNMLLCSLLIYFKANFGTEMLVLLVPGESVQTFPDISWEHILLTVQVRLDKASMPAPAVASLYLNGNIARMLTPERALYQTAMHLTWPAALTNDDEYLCCQISELLLDDSERQGLDRNLPRCWFSHPAILIDVHYGEI